MPLVLDDVMQSPILLLVMEDRSLPRVQVVSRVFEELCNLLSLFSQRLYVSILLGELSLVLLHQSLQPLVLDLDLALQLLLDINQICEVPLQQADIPHRLLHRDLQLLYA
jgi:hypothetical protein